MLGGSVARLCPRRLDIARSTIPFAGAPFLARSLREKWGTFDRAPLKRFPDPHLSQCQPLARLALIPLDLGQ